MAALGPADLPGVFACLRSALSQNSTERKQAEAALGALEARAGFCSCLAVRARGGGRGRGQWLAAAAWAPGCCWMDSMASQPACLPACLFAEA